MVLLLCYMLGIMGNLKGVFYSYCLILLYIFVGSGFDCFNILVCDIVMFVVLMFYVNVWGVFYIVVM